MLLIGMDVSGDEHHSNYRYLGVVVGTHENILGLSDSIGPFPEHMSRISVQERDQLIEKLAFDSRNRIALCITLNRQEIIDQIMSLRQSRQRKIGKGKILRTYNRVIIEEVKKRIERFVLDHGESVTEITIQCDNDSNPFVKAGALQYARKGAAYRISDYVAWCNNRNKSPETVIEIDFTAEIPEKMKKILKLN